MTPKNIGGVEIEVDLSFDGSRGIENPFKSSAVESYLVEQWLKIVPVTSGAIIDNIEIAKDVTLSLSNAHSESLVREMKDKSNPEKKIILASQRHTLTRDTMTVCENESCLFRSMAKWQPPSQDDMLIP